MAALYSAGYGGDQDAAYRQQFMSSADSPQQAPAVVSPYAQQAQRLSSRVGGGGGRGNDPNRRPRTDIGSTT